MDRETTRRKDCEDESCEGGWGELEMKRNGFIKYLLKRHVLKLERLSPEIRKAIEGKRTSDV